MTEPVQPREDPPAARFLSVAEVARIFGVSDLTVYREIRSGKLPAVKFRRRYVVPLRAINAMEDAAVQSGGLVDAADWAHCEKVADEPASAIQRLVGRPRPGANQTGAGSFSTQHMAGYGEDATPTRRTAHGGGVR